MLSTSDPITVSAFGEAVERSVVERRYSFITPSAKPLKNSF
jgi:hypothetical protein